MDPSFDSTLYNDFGFNSSPVATNTYQMDEFKLGIGIDNSRYADTDFDYSPNYTAFDLDPSFCQPSLAGTPESIASTPNITTSSLQCFPEGNLIEEESKKAKKSVPQRKHKKRTLVFQPFASFEATEMTVQSLQRNFLENQQKLMGITRAHSCGVMGFDL